MNNNALDNKKFQTDDTEVAQDTLKVLQQDFLETRGHKTFVRGPCFQRLLATAMDYIILNVLFIMADGLISVGLGLPFFFDPLIDVELEVSYTTIFLQNSFGIVSKCSLIFFYFGLFHKYLQSTPGKFFFNMSVIHLDTGRPPGMWRSFFRETLGKVISIFVFFTGVFMMLFRKDNKGLHDVIFDTQVIKKV